MSLTKEQKQKIIDDLKEKIDRQKAIVFASITGLKVKDTAGLRRKIKEKDCELKVAKKTLIALTLKEKKYEVDIKELQGEIALGFNYRDETSLFKTLFDFSKVNENLKILGGLIGKEFIGKEKALEIAQLPTREELLAKVVGSIRAPLSGLVNVLEGNIRDLVFVLSAIKSNTTKPTLNNTLNRH